jgi:hypothetical protein
MSRRKIPGFIPGDRPRTDAAVENVRTRNPSVFSRGYSYCQACRSVCYRMLRVSPTASFGSQIIDILCWVALSSISIDYVVYCRTLS